MHLLSLYLRVLLVNAAAVADRCVCPPVAVIIRVVLVNAAGLSGEVPAAVADRCVCPPPCCLIIRVVLVNAAGLSGEVQGALPKDGPGNVRVYGTERELLQVR